MKRIITAAAFMLIASPALAYPFGAVAYSANDVAGWAGGSATPDDADRWALLDCERKGGKDCKVMAREDRGGCAAIAAGTNGKGGAASTHGDMRPPGAIARQTALEDCITVDTDCEVKAWVCH
ncbi:DUF4189 domain-containing protein [Bradyrhizobium sp. USDA 313]|uniref:DUF4189 domain-containing protein n=1 Tax=Bradyrhizobium sp. USDA 313 TaxID=3156307 RepID=UPI00351923E8